MILTCSSSSKTVGRDANHRLIPGREEHKHQQQLACLQAVFGGVCVLQDEPSLDCCVGVGEHRRQRNVSAGQQIVEDAHIGRPELHLQLHILQPIMAGPAPIDQELGE